MSNETKIPVGFDVAAFEETAGRVREFNARLLESSKVAGLAGLDAYEKAVKSLVDFEQTVAGATQVEWVSTLANTHAKFIQEVSSAYTEGARSLLK